MKLSIKVASTSQTVNVFIQDSSSTTGAGLTGLAFNTASLVAYYALPKAAAVVIALATLAAVTSAYSSGGFKEIDATNMPGWYRLDLPDAAIASGRFVSIHLKGATNMAPLPLEIELTAWDNQDTVRGGLTALPNAAAGAAGGLMTCAIANVLPSNSIVDASYDTTAGKMSALGIIDQGTAQAATSTTLQLRSADAYADSELVGAVIMIVSATTGAGQCRQITGYVGATDTATVDAWNTTPTGTIVYKIFAGPPGTAASLASIAAAVWDLATAGHTTSGTFGAAMNAAGSAGDPWATSLPGGYGAGTAGAKVGNFLTGDSYVRLGAPAGASHAVDTAAVKTDTGNIVAKTANLTFTIANQVDVNVVDWKGLAAPAMTGDAFARLGAPAGASTAADIAAVNAKTANLPGSPAAVGSAMTLTSGERTAAADALLDRDMSVGTDSGSPTVRTPRQALRALRNKVGPPVGSVLTITKEDDTTASWTATVTTDAAAVPITGIDPAG